MHVCIHICAHACKPGSLTCTEFDDKLREHFYPAKVMSKGGGHPTFAFFSIKFMCRHQKARVSLASNCINNSIQKVNSENSTAHLVLEKETGYVTPVFYVQHWLSTHVRRSIQLICPCFNFFEGTHLAFFSDFFFPFIPTTKIYFCYHQDKNVHSIDYAAAEQWNSPKDSPLKATNSFSLSLSSHFLLYT